MMMETVFAIGADLLQVRAPDSLTAMVTAFVIPVDSTRIPVMDLPIITAAVAIVAPPVKVAAVAIRATVLATTVIMVDITARVARTIIALPINKQRWVGIFDGGGFGSLSN